MASKGAAPGKELLVDDDNTVRFTPGKILEHHGFNVSSAANVPDALRLISSGAFDVLLSDLHMPGPGGGLTVVSAMRHSSEGGHVAAKCVPSDDRCCKRHPASKLNLRFGVASTKIQSSRGEESTIECLTNGSKKVSRESVLQHIAMPERASCLYIIFVINCRDENN